MAKQPSSRGGTTKVRFLMLEAEGAESDLTQIFAAIQSAVKPGTTVVQHRVVSNSRDQSLLSDDTAVDASGNVDEEQAEGEDTIVTAAPRRVKPKVSRKPSTPEVLDFDFDTDVSLADFSGQHSASDKTADRYLVIAAWFKEHRDTPAITTAHIYTGYRVLSWSTDIEDFGAILRYLKGQDLMRSGNRGGYIINHLGLARVKKLANG